MDKQCCVWLPQYHGQRNAFLLSCSIPFVRAYFIYQPSIHPTMVESSIVVPSAEEQDSRKRAAEDNPSEQKDTDTEVDHLCY